jgi:hypothetical protein
MRQTDKLYPVWATGFLEQELCLVTPDDPSLLVDCRTRTGQSGSAVIAYRVGTCRTRKEYRVQSTLSPTPIWEFLGIYDSRVNRDSDLGKVWHVSAVEEVLDAAAADTAKRIAQSLSKRPQESYDGSVGTGLRHAENDETALL